VQFPLTTLIRLYEFLKNSRLIDPIPINNKAAFRKAALVLSAKTVVTRVGGG
jgi:hypothetical protein